MNLIKHPKIPHLPFSPGKSRDDMILSSVKHFEGKKIIVTVKMDGENTTLYRNYIHARSLTYTDHESRHWMKRYHAEMKHLIPENTRICGENLYAKHSIHYQNLQSYFLVHSIWEGNKCLDWGSTIWKCGEWGFIHVPVLWAGEWNEVRMRHLFRSRVYENECEGFVVRLWTSFFLGEYSKSIAKYVRKGHIQIDEHWMKPPIVPNLLVRQNNES